MRAAWCNLLRCLRADRAWLQRGAACVRVGTSDGPGPRGRATVDDSAWTCVCHHVSASTVCTAMYTSLAARVCDCGFVPSCCCAVQDASSGDLKPGRKGIALRPDQWDTLKGVLGALRQALEAGDTAVTFDLADSRRAYISEYK